MIALLVLINAAMTVAIFWIACHYWPRISKAAVHRSAFENHTALAMARGDAETIKKLLLKSQLETVAEAAAGTAAVAPAIGDDDFILPNGQRVPQPGDFSDDEWSAAKYRAQRGAPLTTIEDVVRDMRAERDMRDLDHIPAPIGAEA